jgi:hypothetical protein
VTFPRRIGVHRVAIAGSEGLVIVTGGEEEPVEGADVLYPDYLSANAALDPLLRDEWLNPAGRC